MKVWKPDVVYHTAAYKHVPMVEQNPVEGIKNNVYGTLNMALTSLNNNVKSFVFISTDKAVRPTNIMGASKRLSEILLQGLATQHLIEYKYSDELFIKCNNNTRFSIVRFGNVLNSAGSVVPLFRNQISSGGPITVTHPEVTRYFMSIPEAVILVMHTGIMANNNSNKNAQVYLLDMGEPVKILDLAYEMVELSGLRVKDDHNVNGDIQIEYTGLRHGEKLFEELLINENPIKTDHPKYLKLKKNF